MNIALICWMPSKNLVCTVKYLLAVLLLIGSTSCSKKVYVVYHNDPPRTYAPSVQQSPLPQETKTVASLDQTLKPPYRLKKLIVIDPGHGGDDFGTQSLTKPIFREKHLNLATAQILQNYLKQMGYQTIMTRVDDTFIPLDKRALFANEKNPDLFVSVHFNSAPSQQAEGVEVFYYKADDDKTRTQSSKLLAQTILSRVIENTDAKSRGVKSGNLAVIRETKMPAILIEGGFLTNESELQKIKDANYLKRLAWGIAQGIQDYINKG